jgi:hypothetical protein
MEVWRNAVRVSQGIKKVTSIDYEYSNVLALYGTYCVIVTGE